MAIRDLSGIPRFAAIRRVQRTPPEQTQISRALCANASAVKRVEVENDPTVLAGGCTVEQGDFIQLKRWFFDTFAEVINAVGESGQQTIYYCAYGRHGRERFIAWSNEAQDPLRHVVKCARLPCSAAVKYAANRFERSLYVGRGGPVSWPRPLASDSTSTRAHPEVHPTLRT